MKKLFFILAILLPLVMMAQDAEPLTISEVIQVEGKSKAEIYSGLRIWVATTYKSAQKVIQMDDKESGTLIIKAIFNYKKGGMFYSAYEGHVSYTLKLQAKDGRFRAEMSNISHENKPGNAKNCCLGLITTAEKYTDKGANKKYHNNVWNDIKEKAQAEANTLFESLKLITDFNDSNTDDDW